MVQNSVFRQFKMAIRFIILILLFTFATGDKLPGNLIGPGRSCDPVLWQQLVRPSSDALRQLYREVETEKQIGAAVMFGTAARNMHRSLHSLIEVPESEINKGAYKKKAGDDILASKACFGLVASYMTCDQEKSECVCKTEFPFNFTLVRGECHGLPGSICAVDKSFVLPCSDGLICEDGIKSMRFCGGITEYTKAQQISLELDPLPLPKINDSVARNTTTTSQPEVMPVASTTTAYILLDSENIQLPTKTSQENKLREKVDELSTNLSVNSERLTDALQKIQQLEAIVLNITDRFEKQATSVNAQLHKHRVILLGVPEDPKETENSLRARIETLVDSKDLTVQGVMCGRLERLGTLRTDGQPRAVKINYCF